MGHHPSLLRRHSLDLRDQPSQPDRLGTVFQPHLRKSSDGPSELLRHRQRRRWSVLHALRIEVHVGHFSRSCGYWGRSPTISPPLRYFLISYSFFLDHTPPFFLFVQSLLALYNLLYYRINPAFEQIIRLLDIEASFIVETSRLI